MICPNCKIKCNKEKIEGKTWFRCPKCVFVTSPGDTHIKKLYAITAKDPISGNDSLIATSINGVHMSLVNSDKNLLMQAFNFAKDQFPETEIYLKEFSLVKKDKIL